MAEVVVMPPAVGGEIQREGSDDSVVELCVRTLDKKEWTMMVRLPLTSRASLALPPTQHLPALYALRRSPPSCVV